MRTLLVALLLTTIGAGVGLVGAQQQQQQRLDDIPDAERIRELVKHLRNDREVKDEQIATMRAYILRLEARGQAMSKALADCADKKTETK